MIRGCAECIMGLPGAGKTYLAVRRAYQARRRDHSLVVASNIESLFFPWGPPPIYAETLEEICKLSDVWLIMDEAHLLLPSRGSRDMPSFVGPWISQLRKRHIHLTYTVQDVANVDAMLRRVTEELYLCDSAVKVGWFKYKVYPQVRTSGKGSVPGGFMFNKIIANCYDTHQTIGTAANMR